MGLGPFPAVSLADARIKAGECRRDRAGNVDPLDARAAEKQKKILVEKGQTSFRECAESYIALHEVTWKNPKHRQQWRNTLATYAYPVIGKMAVAKIGAPDVLRILEPIWAVKSETASRLRGRIRGHVAIAEEDFTRARIMRTGQGTRVEVA